MKLSSRILPLIAASLSFAVMAAVPTSRSTPQPQGDINDIELDHDLEATADTIDSHYLEPVQTVGANDFFDETDELSQANQSVQHQIQLDIETRVGAKVSHSTLIVSENDIGHIDQVGEADGPKFDLRFIPTVLKPLAKGEKAGLTVRMDIARLEGGNEKHLSTETLVTQDGRKTKMNSTATKGKDAAKVEVTVIPTVIE